MVIKILLYVFNCISLVSKKNNSAITASFYSFFLIFLVDGSRSYRVGFDSDTLYANMSLRRLVGNTRM